MAFKNRVRLPFYLTRPQFPDERQVFRFADGTTRVMSVVIKKTYEGITDFWPEWVHQRMKIALSHDLVNIEGDRYLGGVVLENDYEIDWQEFLDYPYAQAKFKIQVTPFNMSNANCQSCDEAMQLDLHDDNLDFVLDQSTTYNSYNVFTNDIINCYPVTVEIIYINPVFVDSASVDPETGVLTFTTKPLFFQRATVKILTYRVTCPNGGFDEADIYANLNGDPSACNTPSGITATTVGEDSATIDWTEPSTGAPDDGYEWKYTLASTPATVIETGTTSALTLAIPTNATLLDPSTDYIFSVRSICDLAGGVYSDWVNVPFTTTADSEVCGRYNVSLDHGLIPKRISYIACSGNIKNVLLRPFKVRQICCAQTSPGNPVSVIGADTVTYVSPC